MTGVLVYCLIGAAVTAVSTHLAFNDARGAAIRRASGYSKGLVVLATILAGLGWPLFLSRLALDFMFRNRK